MSKGPAGSDAGDDAGAEDGDGDAERPERSGPRVYTRTGDRGTTALLAGGRVAKNHPAIEVNGAVDEAQALLGLARAECDAGAYPAELLLRLERELWVLMGEVATAPEHRDALRPGETAVTAAMVRALEREIDVALATGVLERAFAVPGENRLSACLDVARTVVRRAERLAVALPLPGSQVVPYLNRLSDLCWALARATEEEHRVQHRPQRLESPRPNEER